MDPRRHRMAAHVRKTPTRAMGGVPTAAARAFVQSMGTPWRCRVRTNPRDETIMLRLNEGHIDRGLRLVLGILFGTVALTGAGGAIPVVIGTTLAITMFATAAVGFCPLYVLLGFDTLPAGAEVRSRVGSPSSGIRTASPRASTIR